MKVTTKAKEDARDCFIMAHLLGKLKCAVKDAHNDVRHGNGSGVKFELRRVSGYAYELGMLHPDKKAEFEKMGEEFSALVRHTKNKLSSNRSRRKMQDRLTKIDDQIRNLRAGIETRCHVPIQFQGGMAAD